MQKVWGGSGLDHQSGGILERIQGYRRAEGSPNFSYLLNIKKLSSKIRSFPN